MACEFLFQEKLKMQLKYKKDLYYLWEVNINDWSYQKSFESYLGDFSLNDVSQLDSPADINIDQIKALMIYQYYMGQEITSTHKISKRTKNHLNQIVYVCCFDVWLPHNLSKNLPIGLHISDCEASKMNCH